MDWERELSFFEGIARQLHLDVHIAPMGSDVIFRADMGLRGMLGLDGVDWSERLNGLRHRVIYRITDEFGCKYAILLIPNEPVASVLVVGPYVTEEGNQGWLRQLGEQNGIHTQWMPVLERYFRDVPYLSREDMLSAALNTLGECIWRGKHFTSERIIAGVPEAWMPLADAPETQTDMMADIRSIEKRYEAENRLIQLVSQGRSHTAELMVSSFSQKTLEQRTDTPTRDAKNYTIILNTLLRKAVEQGGVHPLYIDRLSSEFAHRIETLPTCGDVENLWREMVNKYCLLVRKNANQKYSPLVQKVMTRVDFDLAADLGLKANAKALNVNASYLSALFKKETGTTLTDYVNRKRMEYATFLLSTTTLSVSVVGQRCGIQDDNYFTKIFKKYIGKTPKQYRQENYQFFKSLKK